MHLNKSVVTNFTNLIQLQTRPSDQQFMQRTDRAANEIFHKCHLCSPFKWKQHFRINLKSEHSKRDCRQQYEVPLPPIPLAKWDVSADTCHYTLASF